MQACVYATRFTLPPHQPEPMTRVPTGTNKHTNPNLLPPQTHLRGSSRNAVGEHAEAGEEDLHAVPAGLVGVGRLLRATPHGRQPRLGYGAVARVSTAAAIAPGVQGVTAKDVIHVHVCTAHMHRYTRTYTHTLVAVE